ncbi:MAG: FHA domain-containing protein [Anaerolineae bacterium]
MTDLPEKPQLNSPPQKDGSDSNRAPEPTAKPSISQQEPPAAVVSNAAQSEPKPVPAAQETAARGDEEQPVVKTAPRSAPETGLDLRAEGKGKMVDEARDSKPDLNEPAPAASPASPASSQVPPPAQPAIPPQANQPPVSKPSVSQQPVNQPPVNQPPAAPHPAQPMPSTAPISEKESASPSADVQGGSSKSAVVFCPNCNHVNRYGTLVCEKCNFPLVKAEKDGISTKRFGQNASEAAPEPAQTNNLPSLEKAGSDGVPAPAVPAGKTLSAADIGKAISSAGTDRFDKDMVLRFEIEGAPQPILFYPKPETHIGRRDPLTGTSPEIDLTAFAGYRMGVSRNHCILRLNENRLELTDLGSSNGTALNGEKLKPHIAHTLRDGDELMLGKMAIRVIFQKRR